ETDTNSFFFAIWSPAGNILKSSTNAPAAIARPNPDGAGLIRAATIDQMRVAFYFNGIGDCILVGQPIADFRHASQRFALFLLTAGGIVLFIGLGGGWILTSRALQPIHDISK